MNPKALLAGFALWLFGTALIRFAPRPLLRIDAPARIATLYALSFVCMAWLIPRLSARLAQSPAQRFEATALLILPTLLLDPWACLFFPRVYPNFPAAAAGLFGGWMLVFCAGAAAGALAQAWRRRNAPGGAHPQP